MTEPKITFKNIKTFQGMEGEGLNAQIYINGVKCFFMRDAGDGGDVIFDKYSNIHNPSIAVDSNVQLLDAWIATLPSKVIQLSQRDDDGRGELIIEVDYEIYFNQKYDDFMKTKDALKFEKKKMEKYKTAIVLGNPATPERYTFIDYKRPLSYIPKFVLQEQVTKAIAKHCINGIEILNKNHITSLGIVI